MNIEVQVDGNGNVNAPLNLLCNNDYHVTNPNMTIDATSVPPSIAVSAAGSCGQRVAASSPLNAGLTGLYGEARVTHRRAAVSRRLGRVFGRNDGMAVIGRVTVVEVLLRVRRR